MRAFRVRLGETQQHWFEPALSADWYADQPRDWAGPTNVYVIAVDDPQTLTSLIANRLTRGWGVRQLITGGGTHLSYTSSDNEQVLLGLDSSGMSAENYPTAVVTGKIYKYIVSGNVLLAFPGVSLPRPE